MTRFLFSTPFNAFMSELIQNFEQISSPETYGLHTDKNASENL